MADPRWVRRRFRVPDPSVESFTADLWLDSPLGIELRPGGVDVYYSEEELPVLSVAEPEVLLEAEDIVVAEDWLAGWRSAAAPFSLGERFWIDPREESSGVDGEPEPGRIALRLPARRAFGTGSHPTTRLAVSWLEEMPMSGRRVLDLGAGSGILSFVCSRLGASSVLGIERELESALLAGANRRLNRIGVVLVAGTGALLAHPRLGWGGLGAARFDLIVANLLSSHLLPELPGLAPRLRAGGDFVYSGALTVERRELMAGFAAVGLDPVGEKIDGEWSAWRLQAEVGARPRQIKVSR